MASLGEVLGAIISQIDKGRCQADMATLEIAQLYKDHPLLSSFPVPRVTLEEVVIDLKFAIDTVPPSGRFITSKAREEVLAQVKEMTNNIMKEPSLTALSKRYPELPRVWESIHPQIVQKLSKLIPTEEIEIEPESIAYGLASIIRGYLTDVILSLEVKIRQLPVVRNFLTKDALQIEAKLASQIRETISKVLEVQPSIKDRLDVLVTAHDLQTIPPEKIDTLRLTLREEDRSWTQVETEKGEIRDKLTP